MPKLNKEQFLQAVKELVISKTLVSESEFTPESRFVEDLGLDSLDKAELIMDLMQEFEVHIPENDQVQITTLGEAAEYTYLIYSKK